MIKTKGTSKFLRTISAILVALSTLGVLSEGNPAKCKAFRTVLSLF